jgi:hypothetical protein
MINGGYSFPNKLILMTWRDRTAGRAMPLQTFAVVILTDPPAD